MKIALTRETMQCACADAIKLNLGVKFLSIDKPIRIKECLILLVFSWCFYWCNSYNKPFRIKKCLILLVFSWCFYLCNSYNKPFRIKECLILLVFSRCFYWCNSYNKPFRIKECLILLVFLWCFHWCNSYNKPQEPTYGQETKIPPEILLTSVLINLNSPPLNASVCQIS